MSTRDDGQPTLAVLMANYNHARLLPRALDAVRTQGRPPDQVIVLDDASTDDSVEVLEAYRARWPLVRPVLLTTNGGVVRAYNRLLGEATADYVYCAAADDYVLPGFFEQALALAGQYPQAGVIFGQVVSLDVVSGAQACRGPARWTTAGYYPPDRYRREVLEVEPPSLSFSSATIYRRAAFQEAGGEFPATVASWTDSFVIQAVGLRHGVAYFPQPAVVWTYGAHGFSQTQTADPARVLAMVRNAGALMRSDPHAAVFPADYVRGWARRYARQVIAEGTVHYRNSLVTPWPAGVERFLDSRPHCRAWATRLAKLRALVLHGRDIRAYRARLAAAAADLLG